MRISWRSAIPAQTARKCCSFRGSTRSSSRRTARKVLSSSASARRLRERALHVSQQTRFNPMSYDQHVRSAKDIVARCAVVTLSDTRTRETDISGQLILKLLAEAGHQVTKYHLIKDDRDALASLLLELASDPDI